MIDGLFHRITPIHIDSTLSETAVPDRDGNGLVLVLAYSHAASASALSLSFVVLE